MEETQAMERRESIRTVFESHKPIIVYLDNVKPSNAQGYMTSGVIN